MIDIALFEPEIPPNTGNIMRLCANTGSRLHLIHPLGFDLDEKKLRRAGMDYRDMATIQEHQDYKSFLEFIGERPVFALTTKGKTTYTDAKLIPDSILLFGPETRGLPDEVLETFEEENKLRLPMLKDSRSLNLSNTVAIVTYEALRQNHFESLGKLKQKAEELSLPLTVVSFEPLPAEYFSPTPPTRIYPLRDKIRLMEKLGVNNFLCLRFDENFANMPPKDFVVKYSTRLFELVRVRHGDKRGRTISFPTINLKVPENISPKRGVYAVKVHGLNGTPYYGVANLGNRPTVVGLQNRLEVHLFEFSESVYGKYICVELLEFIREEKRFEDIDELKNQITIDADKAKEIIDVLSNKEFVKCDYLSGMRKQQQAEQSAPQNVSVDQPYNAPNNAPAPVAPPEAEDLFAAANAGNVNQLRSLLSQGLDINISNRERETSLHMAAARGHYQAVIFLVNQGAYVNAKTVKNWIPLHHAVRFRHPNIVNFLINHGSSAYSRTSDGLTAVDMAKNVNDYRLLSILGAR
ncbi:tRNA (cytidine(34)-2'-O)-methyltransferase [Nymphon striatum]|nr:tRNA (cytidine(34)-2'-O)-methyltransferase [Nymphon striatum]